MHPFRRLSAVLGHISTADRDAPSPVLVVAGSVKFDLVIRGGTVVDGSGKARYRADLGIAGDTIVAVGAGLGRGAEEIDASGRLVTPGWVDVHTHFDAQVCWDPYFAPAPHNGATTVIFGNVSPPRPQYTATGPRCARCSIA